VNWIRNNRVLAATIAFVAIMGLWMAYSGILKVPAISLPSRVTAPAEETSVVEVLEAKIDTQTEAITEAMGEQTDSQTKSITETLTAQTAAINSLVEALPVEPAAQAPQAEAESVSPTEPPAPQVEETEECLPGATTKQAQALTGVSVQRIDTECSTWVWRGAPEETVLATCPQGWICTWDEIDDIVVVQEGVGQPGSIYAGTFRQVSAFPSSDAVHDVCELFRKERDLGMREDLSFQVRFQAIPGGVQQCS